MAVRTGPSGGPRDLGGLGVELDPRAEVPLYQQLFDEIVSRIKNGALPDGYRLPATRALSQTLGTHRNTVVRAYEALESAGFVLCEVGRGTFVQVPESAALVPQEEESANIPWASLTSRACEAEPLSRLERLASSVVASAAINLTRMQPADELMPAKLLSRCVEHVLRTYGAKALAYAPRDGVARLREAIAEDLVRQGVPASADDVLITTGSQQALDLIARALINPGDSILVECSTYAGALNVFSAAGARLLAVGADEHGPSMSALGQLERSGAKALYLMPNCQNPTGRTISLARRKALLRWSAQTGIPLIEDDYAADLVMDGPLPPALRAHDGEVIYVGTFSKKLIPALRVGFMLLPRALRARMVTLKHAMDLGTSALMQYALAEFLERGYMRAHLQRLVPEYRRRRDALLAALRASLPGSIRPIEPKAGMAVWVPLVQGLEPEQVFHAAHQEGVLVSPNTLYSVGPTSTGGVRLAFCSQSPRRLAQGGRRLGRSIERLMKSSTRGPRARAPLEVV